MSSIHIRLVNDKYAKIVVLMVCLIFVKNSVKAQSEQDDTLTFTALEKSKLDF